MIYIYAAILCGYLALWMISWREEGKGPFWRMASYFVRRGQTRRKKTGRKHSWQQEIYRRQLGNKLKTLQPGLAVQTQVKNYYKIGRAHV